jgi:hypothetical protein
MVQYSLRRLLAGVTLASVGFAADAYAFRAGVSTWPIYFVWMAAGAAIGAGVLLPFKWFSIAEGAAIGVLVQGVVVVILHSIGIL